MIRLHVVVQRCLSVLILISAWGILTGCGEQYYSRNDFETVEKIDVHVHIRTDDESLLKEAKKNNFKILNVNVDSPGSIDVSSQKEFALQLKESNPEQVDYISTFEMDGWSHQNSWQNNTLDYLQESFDTDALGVKVWKNIGMVERYEDGRLLMIDDPLFDPILRYISDQDKTLLAHIGEPKNCWLPLDQMTTNNDRSYFESHPKYHMYLHPEYPSYEEIINARDNMLQKHPNLRVVGAHLGSMEWSIDMMAEHLDKYPNMALETAARIPHLQYLTQKNRDEVRQFFIKYQDRLLYGTDLSMNQNSDSNQVQQRARETWQEDWNYFVSDDSLNVSEVKGPFRGLKLPKKVIDKLYRKNAEKWFPGI